MGQVVPFIARLRDSGDWTAAERARLQDLASQLSASGVHVEVIFGATDEGDPWCVVTDENGDVLIHVARIDGKFVVHSAVDDAVNESADLHAALRDSLEATEEVMAPRSATILPFGLTARQGQTFLALLAATTFFYETASVGDSAEAAEPVHIQPSEDPPPPPVDTDTPTQDRETVAQGVALQPSAAAGTTALAAAAPAAEAASNAGSASAPTAGGDDDHLARAPATAAETTAPAAPAEPKILIQGTAGDDLLVGSAADEHLVGGDGNDTLRGGGGNDLLEGGAGDDVIEITSHATAIGGKGADTFLIQAPVQMGRAEQLLGTILDFDRLEGDRIFSWTGQTVRLMPHQPPPGGEDGDKTPAPPTTAAGDFTTTATTPPGPTDRAPGGSGGETGHGGGDSSGFGPTTVDPNPPTLAPHPPLVRVDVDLDGDGAADGYILLGVRGGMDVNAATVGAGFGYTDPVG